MDINIDLNNIINAIVTVVVAWLGYNQYTKNKKIDYEIQSVKEQSTLQRKKNRSKIAKTYGLAHKLLSITRADRVIIGQPHPLADKSPVFFTAAYEVTRVGVSEVSEQGKPVKISAMASVASMLAENNTLKYQDVKDLEEKVLKRVLLSHGVGSVIIKRLVSLDGDWAGSVFIEYLKPNSIPADITEKTEIIIETMQSIIPDYE